MSTIASTPSAKVSDEQIGKLFDQIRPGIRKSSITGETFQQMLSQEGLLKIRSRFVNLLLRIASEIIEPVMVTVDYDEEDAIAQALLASRLDHDLMNVEIEDIPLGGQGQKEHEVFELRLDQGIKAADLSQELESCGMAFVDVLTALRYATQMPDRLNRPGMVTLFTDKRDQLCSLFMIQDSRGKYAYMDTEAPNTSWFETRLLVVRKPA